MVCRQTFYMGFVDDGLMPRVSWMSVFAPVIGGVDDLAEGSKGGVVARVGDHSLALVLFGIIEYTRVPFQGASDLFCIGVREEFCRIEAMTRRGIVRAVNAIAI